MAFDGPYNGTAELCLSHAVFWERNTELNENMDPTSHLAGNVYLSGLLLSERLMSAGP
jgi:hypothetical protein